MAKDTGKAPPQAPSFGPAVRHNMLFLERCSQIQILLQSHKEIDILDIGARLRQMILDKHCLMAVANLNRVKIRFEVGYIPDNAISGPLAPDYYSLEDGVDPETGLWSEQPRVRLGIDKFLAHPVMII